MSTTESALSNLLPLVSWILRGWASPVWSAEAKVRWVWAGSSIGSLKLSAAASRPAWTA